MIADRPYRAGLAPETARAELLRCAGSQFDPEVVEAFLRMLERRRTSRRCPRLPHLPAGS